MVAANRALLVEEFNDGRRGRNEAPFVLPAAPNYVERTQNHSVIGKLFVLSQAAPTTDGPVSACSTEWHRALITISYYRLDRPKSISTVLSEVDRKVEGRHCVYTRHCAASGE